ncbi:MAG: hypothetical protein FJ304_15630 [Planctomycetes bacterium]|nr:hypothetical protein [Planctomycetota bacterium]
MRRLFNGFGFVCVLAVATAAPPEPDPEEARKRAHRAREAAKLLGSPEYRLREQAAQQLKELGEAALPELREATKSDDPEVRHRAHGLLVAVLRAAGVSKSTKLVMSVVLAHEFEMGSPNGERAPQEDETLHQVRLTRAYLIGTYEVTQAQYRKVMDRNPSWFAFSGGGSDKVKGKDTGPYPVEQVSWYDALDFCNKISALDGYPPYYKLTNVVSNKNESITAATVTVLGGTGYRLPTEAEWEAACRSWTITPFHHGRTTYKTDANAKLLLPGGGYSGPETYELGRTAEVGSYKANRRGMYDTHGNVGEWCADWYGATYYEKSPRDDPKGPDTGAHKVVRGGSWLVSDTSCRSASRGALGPGERSYTVGFRVARTP